MQTIRKLLEQEEAKITLLWNEEADNAAKESLDENLEKTEKYRRLNNPVRPTV
jgi:hypothetical protein